MSLENLRNSFEKLIDLQLPQPLGESGEILHKDLKIKYIFTNKASGKTVLDFLIFERYGFPPIHKRINANGEIQDLENFGFSLMYETSEERQEQEMKMNETNREIANLIITKGLAERDENWIQKYLKKFKINYN